MPCYSPLIAFQTDSGEVVFAERGNIKRELRLPCGRCVGCMLERSRQWAIRCMHETSMHEEESSFATLTYSDEFLPSDYSLCHRDFQLFIKRLIDKRYRDFLKSGIDRVRARKRARVRYYMCGEYGELNSRPHYHCILFGVDFPDKYYWRKTESGFDVFRSETLENLWGLGNCEIGNVTFQSAAYCAAYCIEELTHAGREWILDPETGELYERKRQYSRMSLKPGIGSGWYEKYKSEVFPQDRVVFEGREQKPPKYYDKLLDREPGTVSDDVSYARYLRAQRLIVDQTDDRLRVREKVAHAKRSNYRRSGK